MEPVKLLLVDGYQLQLSCTASYLFVEAEEMSSGRTFSLKLDSDSVTQLTNGLFEDIQTMHQGLTEAASKAHPGVEIVIRPGGKIKYTVSLSAGVVRKEYGFSLDLEEKVVEPAMLLEKKVVTLTSEVKRLEQKVVSLEDKIDKMNKDNEKAHSLIQDLKSGQVDSMKELEKTSSLKDEISKLRTDNEKSNFQISELKKDQAEKLEKIGSLKEEISKLKTDNEKVTSQISALKQDNEENMREFSKSKVENEKRCSELAQQLQRVEEVLLRKSEESAKEQGLDNVSVNKDKNFYFNTSSRNASHYAFSNNNKTISKKGNIYHVCLECFPSIPNNGLHQYSIRIHRGTNWIFGISSTIKTENWNEDSYRYYTPDGGLYPGRNHAKLPTGSVTYGKINIVITMTVDMNNGTLTFLEDNKIVTSGEFPKDKTYYAYVSCTDEGDSVTLL